MITAADILRVQERSNREPDFLASRIDTETILGEVRCLLDVLPLDDLPMLLYCAWAGGLEVGLRLGDGQ